ncbi:MAG TPA: endolytic transglycosylase MltG [Bacteroidales bacterium]|nr:endolytic transglycosylase MltG [Bacteroidales bacterium]HPS50718.1 endolytic transglycosylase MltG [Bacteroidales bacterium]
MRMTTIDRNHPERSRLPRLGPIILVLTTVLVVLISAIHFYYRTFTPVIRLQGKKEAFIHIPSGSGFRDVIRLLQDEGKLKSPGNFRWLAERKHYVTRVKPGKYRLRDGMTNNELVNMLRSGKQTPVRITIQNIRTPMDLAGRIGRQLECDSIELASVFSNNELLAGYGVTPATVFALIIPDSYEFWWTTTASQFLARMKREQERFWRKQRKMQADSLRMTISEIVTLASIVEKESNRNEEKPIIAGVYLNRLHRGIPLQADPTVIFAWKDYSIKRILKRHTEISSPYNTYRFAGLPPGPICLPSVASIDAVLRPDKHDYLYFCAREDLSGYHRFARTLDEHLQNARRYQKALNNLKIF